MIIQGSTTRDHGHTDTDGDGGVLAYVPSSGWIAAAETWAFVSVDDPTGVFDATGDMRAKYSAGMRIKLTNGGNTIYGIITAVNQTLQSGNTRVTFLHEIDPADSLALTLLADSAITATYYSPVKNPYGFPSQAEKWQVQISDVTQRVQSTPGTTDWYNLGSIALSIPIGSWRVSYTCSWLVTSNPAAANNGQVSLSTANNSQSDADFTIYSQFNSVYQAATVARKEKVLDLAAKTSYYLVEHATAIGSNGAIIIENDLHKCFVIAQCAYL